MACIYPNNGVHFHYENPYMLCYVMDLKQIDIVNVSHMFEIDKVLKSLPTTFDPSFIMD